MSTIAMPTSIHCAIHSITTDAVSQAVKLLSVKYNFDLDEALRSLSNFEITATNPVKQTAAKKTAVKKTAGDKPSAKRAPNGYNLFQKEKRPDIKAKLEEELQDDAKLKPQAILTAIAAEWKLLTPDDKAIWHDLAKKTNDNLEVTSLVPL